MRDCGKDASSSGWAWACRDSGISTLIQVKKLRHRPGAADASQVSRRNFQDFHRGVELVDRIPLQTGKPAYPLRQAPNIPLYHRRASGGGKAGHDLIEFIPLVFTRAQILGSGSRRGCTGGPDRAYAHLHLYAGFVLLEPMFVPLTGTIQVGLHFSITGKNGRKAKGQDADGSKQLAQDLVKLEHRFPHRRSGPGLGIGVAGNKNRQTGVFDTRHWLTQDPGSRPVEWRGSFGHTVEQDRHYFFAGGAGWFMWRMAGSTEVRNK